MCTLYPKGCCEQPEVSGHKEEKEEFTSELVNDVPHATPFHKERIHLSHSGYLNKHLHSNFKKKIYIVLA